MTAIKLYMRLYFGDDGAVPQRDGRLCLQDSEKIRRVPPDFYNFEQ